MNNRYDLKIYHWLLICCSMIIFMIVIGGITRLTDSGLSITNWRPITGIFPPLSHEAWQESFLHYQQFPEYQKINKGMSLSEYQNIFWWEYFHRNWGRLLGLIFFIPFLFFVSQKSFTKNETVCLLGASFLGATQAFVGWWMVKSGMANNPYVSHIRLTCHLALALLLLSLLFSLALNRKYYLRKPIFLERRLSIFIIILVFFLILSGGWVAGQNAGLVYNTFPKMGDYWLPPELFSSLSFTHKVLYDPVIAQFIHRTFAALIFTLIIGYALQLSKYTALSTRILGLIGILILQIGLGITTLLTQVWVPAAVLHQANGILLFLYLIYMHYYTGSIRCETPV